MRSKNAPLSWRRQSMRKTCPIILPEQNPPKDVAPNANREARITRSLSSANRSNLSTTSMTANVDWSTNFSDNFGISNADGNNGNFCFNEITPSSMPTATNACLLADSENNQMSSTSSVQCDHVLANQYDGPNQLPELSSLNNAILSTILTTHNYQQSNEISSANNQLASPQHETHETHFGHNNEEESVHTTSFEESRPRQLGRRSEIRSRIVSITAERNAEGNQVQLTNRLTS